MTESVRFYVVLHHSMIILSFVIIANKLCVTNLVFIQKRKKWNLAVVFYDQKKIMEMPNSSNASTCNF